jgi:hypothetical protein
MAKRTREGLSANGIEGEKTYSERGSEGVASFKL